MKKFTTLVSMFFLVGSFATAQTRTVAKEIATITAQKKTFQSYSLFSKSTSAKKNVEVEKVEYLTLDASLLKGLAQKSPTNIAINLPYDGKEITLELTKNTTLFDDSFYVTDEKNNPIKYTPGVYYRGVIKGESNSLVALSVFDNEVIAVISSDDFGNLNLGALNNDEGKMIKGNKNYVLYSDKYLRPEHDGSFCAADQLPNEGRAFDHNQFAGENQGKFATTKIPTVYYELDYDIYMAKGKDTTAVMNWLTALVNNVHTIYNNDDIDIAMRSTMIWTVKDPYQGAGSTSVKYLEKFRKNRPTFDAHLAQLVGIDPGGLGGVAYLNGLCSQANYSYCDMDNTPVVNFPSYSWNVMVMTHELGHNLGSQHTHACVWNGNDTAIDGCYTLEGNCANPGIPASGGTIMSYCHLQSVGTNFNNGFGPQPKQRIIDFINSSTCTTESLDDICITYHPVYEAVNITPTSAQINVVLNNNEVTNWEYKLSKFSRAIPNTWSSNENNTFNFSDLEANTYYRLRIRKACDVNNFTGVDLVFATSAEDFCSGTEKFVDFGGVNSRYISSENWTRTLMPSQEGSKIKVDFVAFNTEAKSDFLYVFDGVNEDAPSLTPNGLTGDLSNKLPNFEASNEAGALTFKFTSDGSVENAGWEANVSCSVLGTDDQNALVDYSYYPNPVSHEMSFVAKNPFQKIEIYSMDGRKVYSKNYKNVFATQVDMKSLAKGTYLVQVDFNGKTTTFKIVKK